MKLGYKDIYMWVDFYSQLKRRPLIDNKGGVMWSLLQELLLQHFAPQEALNKICGIIKNDNSQV